MQDSHQQIKLHTFSQFLPQNENKILTCKTHNRGILMSNKIKYEYHKFSNLENLIGRVSIKSRMLSYSYILGFKIRFLGPSKALAA